MRTNTQTSICTSVQQIKTGVCMWPLLMALPLLRCHSGTRLHQTPLIFTSVQNRSERQPSVFSWSSVLSLRWHSGRPDGLADNLPLHWRRRPLVRALAAAAARHATQDGADDGQNDHHNEHDDRPHDAADGLCKLLAEVHHPAICGARDRVSTVELTAGGVTLRAIV